MKAADWIDRLKAEREWETDYRAAKELGLSRNTISVYRSKPDATMDDDTAVKVAEALDLEPEIIIIDQVAERTKSEPARAALSGLLQRIAGKVLAGGAGGGGAGRGRVDITSVTPTAPGGDPAGSAVHSVHIVSTEKTRRPLRASTNWTTPLALALRQMLLGTHAPYSA